MTTMQKALQDCLDALVYVIARDMRFAENAMIGDTIEQAKQVLAENEPTN